MRNRWKKTVIVTLGAAVLLTGGSPAGNRNILPELQAAEAEEEEDFLIEDDGEVEVVKEGADLEELQAAEQTEAPETEPLLEDTDIILEPASTERLQEHLDRLTEVESPTGSDGELICGAYIKQVMENYGYTISEQNFHEGFINEDGIDAPGVNIIAERGADSDERNDDIFIICTHYDSKTRPAEDDRYANDKTGTAVLLEMARILSYEETDADICFLFLSGEEDGLYGSASFADSLSEEHKNRIRGVLDVERTGEKEGYVYVLETLDGEPNEIGELLRGLAEKEEILPDVPAEIVTDEGDGRAADGTDASGAGQNPGDEAEENPEGSGEEETDWHYISGSTGSQKSFAEAGLPAVTVRQTAVQTAGRPGEEQPDGRSEENTGNEWSAGRPGEDSGEAWPDVDELCNLTNLLAKCVGSVMNSRWEQAI